MHVLLCLDTHVGYRITFFVIMSKKGPAIFSVHPNIQKEKKKERKKERKRKKRMPIYLDFVSNKNLGLKINIHSETLSTTIFLDSFRRACKL